MEDKTVNESAAYTQKYMDLQKYQDIMYSENQFLQCLDEPNMTNMSLWSGTDCRFECTQYTVYVCRFIVPVLYSP